MKLVQKIKEGVVRHLSNIPGWRTDRKIIVIESDDWGAVRMPSSDVYQRLLDKGIGVDRSPYNRVDKLESRDDLERLFELLTRYNDMRGNHPVITFNTVMGNPQFEKIRASGYEQYFHEHFRATYRRYYGEDLFPLWQEGMNAGVMQPQFHGREHLNVSLWMRALQQGQRETLEAFSENFYGLRTDTPSKYQKDYLAAYWAEGDGDLAEKAYILKEGLRLFEETFGFKSKSFIACNYVLPRELEQELFKNGITVIQGQRGQLAPNITTGEPKIRRAFTGQKNNLNQLHLVRNSFYEPAFDKRLNWPGKCLREIRTSFFWKKPAIISIHRLNFSGGLNTGNREDTLTGMKRLLCDIIQEWPEVEFMSSDKLAIEMRCE